MHLSISIHLSSAHSQVFGSIDEVPHLSALLHSLHACRYADFFGSLTSGTCDASAERFRDKTNSERESLQPTVNILSFDRARSSVERVTRVFLALRRVTQFWSRIVCFFPFTSSVCGRAHRSLFGAARASPAARTAPRRLLAVPGQLQVGYVCARALTLAH